MGPNMHADLRADLYGQRRLVPGLCRGRLPGPNRLLQLGRFRELPPGLHQRSHVPFNRRHSLCRHLRPKHRLQQPLRVLGLGHHLFRRNAFRNHQRGRHRQNGLRERRKPVHCPRQQLVRHQLQHQRLGLRVAGQHHLRLLLLGPANFQSRDRRASSPPVLGHQRRL